MKLCVKLFLAVGIPFGLIIGVFEGIESGVQAGLHSGLTQGIIFGVFMALVLGSLHKLKTRGMSTAEGGPVEPRQTRTQTVEGSYGSVFERCVQALMQIKAKVKTSDRAGGSIMATMPMTWESFGEKLEVSLTKEGSDRVRVTITSSPSQKLTVVDYGKGYKNVMSFFDALMV